MRVWDQELTCFNASIGTFSHIIKQISKLKPQNVFPATICKWREQPLNFTTSIYFVFRAILQSVSVSVLASVCVSVLPGLLVYWRKFEQKSVAIHCLMMEAGIVSETLTFAPNWRGWSDEKMFFFPTFDRRESFVYVSWMDCELRPYLVLWRCPTSEVHSQECEVFVSTRLFRGLSGFHHCIFFYTEGFDFLCHLCDVGCHRYTNERDSYAAGLDLHIRVLQLSPPRLDLAFLLRPFLRWGHE